MVLRPVSRGERGERRNRYASGLKLNLFAPGPGPTPVKVTQYEPADHMTSMPNIVISYTVKILHGKSE